MTLRGCHFDLGKKRAVVRSAGFTLFEILIVVGIIGIIGAIGIPSIARTLQKEGVRKVLWDIQEACEAARSSAVLSGKEATLQFSAEGQISINAEIKDEDGPSSSQLPEGVTIETRWLNYQEVPEDQNAIIRFQPNGTCDEFWVVIRSDENEVFKVTLDIITGLPDVEDMRP